MTLRDYGLGNTDSFVRSIPRAKLATPIDNVVPNCPNCGCQSICEIEVDVDAPMLKGKTGIGKYLGCPACPWASPMLMSSDEATGRKK